ncbi:MAG TPA: division/cell wall cluster transcriptional repressor MraZ [Thermoanaerobaculia bacterium]
MDVNALVGHAPAKVDEKGRLKIPTGFRSLIEEKWGPDCFITSMDGEKAILYPLAVWQEFEARLAKMPSTSQAKIKLTERLAYYGHLGSMDAQGRVLVPAILRKVAGIEDEVVVLGNNDHLTVWNDAKFQKRLADNPLTMEDFKELELHGV